MTEEGPPQRRVTRLLRALLILVAALFVLWLLFFHVFPRVEHYLEDPTLGTVHVGWSVAAGAVAVA